MKAKLMRNFAAGVLLATIVCGSVYYLSPSESSNQTATDGLNTEEMIAALNDEGYSVLTEVELADKLAAAQIEAEENQEQVAVEQTEETTDAVVYRTVITVTTGMTAQDVGDALVSASIIASRQEFVDLIEQRGLVQELRPGSYDVQSTMTIDEVIATIYRQ